MLIIYLFSHTNLVQVHHPTQLSPALLTTSSCIKFSSLFSKVTQTHVLIVSLAVRNQL